ncbi:hypothetical protein PDESU_02432 [Pontiella desulfatans]|uniref:Uncharacterized protein n=1 Tax=Pontiella desulfatans TaxID=2750659 RepID=A0A6C2U1W3_PONDE|nr:hypothetical protein [Pontiella desulfatans]VGO13875.1 hypothetical protein PDESU_02432 [Pontiella desulfatans]
MDINELHEEYSHDDWTPVEKQAQVSLYCNNHGVVSAGLVSLDYNGRCPGYDFVDPMPLPWEYIDEKLFHAKTENSSRPDNTAESSNGGEESFEDLVAVFDDIVVAGQISTRWSRVGANKSVHFKTYHHYCPISRNGQLLADLMNRTRSKPQAYSEYYARKKTSYSSAQRSSCMQHILHEELSLDSGRDTREVVLCNLASDLKTFLKSIVAAAPWDRYEPFDICREIYTCNSECPRHQQARQMIQQEGCALSIVNRVISLIKRFKEREGYCL